VKLSFSREPELNGSYTIDESGLANLPLLGQRQLIDRPAAQAKEELAAEYAERVRNQSVQVTYTRRVRVLGEVRNPGLYQVDPTMTFDDAIALAGGATNEGNLENVRLIRQGEEIVEGLDVSRSVAASIESGDQLYVPKTSWFSRYGAVLIGATISAIGVILAFTN
jgi:polysaccharide export outer membrane protein